MFSTDQFMSKLKQTLDNIANGVQEDMINDAVIIAERLVDTHVLINCDEELINYMKEIGTLADISSNMKHDCRVLFDEFDKRFRYDHGEGKHLATALDAMRIITEIGNDIDNIAPHLGHLFEPDDNCFPSIFNDSFVTTFEIPAE